MVKDYIKIFGATVIRFFCYMFWIFPIKNNRILFSSYSGDSYSCNPKYISELMTNTYPGQYEQIWIFKNPAKYKNIQGIKCIKHRTFKWLYYLATSRFIVTNVAPTIYVPKRKRQIVIQTWHAGGAYKTVAHSQAIKRPASVWYVTKAKKYIDYYISSSKLFTKTNIIEGYEYCGKILNIGMPRNDILIDKDKYNEIRAKTRKQLGIEDSFVVLYAPTYRGTTKHAIKVDTCLDVGTIQRCCEKYSEKRVSVLVRMHHHDRNRYEFDSSVLDVNAIDDMQELLCAADLLITDYSSSIWDYALTGKPCILFVPDLDGYISNRGLYTDIYSWPGVVCKTEEEFENAVLKLDSFDFAEMANRHFTEFESYETGKAGRFVVRLINNGEP